MDEKKRLRIFKWVKVFICFVICMVCSLFFPDSFFGMVVGMIAFITGIVIACKKVKTKEEKIPQFTLKMKKKYNPIYTLENIPLRNSGLPPVISNFTYFDFLLCNDKIVILCDPYEIIIEKDDLKDIHYEHYNKRGVTRVSNGSLVGGMVGESMFGTPGAIVGAAPKVKTSPGETGMNMIIKYKSKDNVLKTLFFQYVACGDFSCKGADIIPFCREVYKTFNGEEIQNGQIIL